MLPSDITTILYSDTLRLIVDTTGETKEFKKSVVDVGRDQIHERPKANIFIDKSDLGDPRKNKKSEK